MHFINDSIMIYSVLCKNRIGKSVVLLYETNASRTAHMPYCAKTLLQSVTKDCTVSLNLVRT
jgi:hypothetical protein